MNWNSILLPFRNFTLSPYIPQRMLLVTLGRLVPVPKLLLQDGPEAGWDERPFVGGCKGAGADVVAVSCAGQDTTRVLDLLRPLTCSQQLLHLLPPAVHPALVLILYFFFPFNPLAELRFTLWHGAPLQLMAAPSGQDTETSGLWCRQPRLDHALSTPAAALHISQPPRSPEEKSKSLPVCLLQ